MSLTISPSPFGSLVVSVAETGSTLSVSTVATSPSVLSMALGVPGPAGATGATGATGQGVAAGGTTGQALVKSSNSDYATTWATISSGGGTWGSITGTLSSQTDLQNALNGKLSLTGGTMSAGALIDFSADTNSNTSELGAWGLGIDNANAGETAYIQSNQIRIWNGDFVNGTSLTPNGINFNDETTQTTAYNPAVLGNYLPLAGGIMSGAIRFDSVGTQNIAKGSFDSGRGGYNGISLNCAVDYELNWQAGYLKALNSGGFTVPVNFDSSLALSDDVFGSGVSKTISANAIDGDSYSGFNLANGGSVSGASLTINFGNTDEGYENQAILAQSSLVFKDQLNNITYASIGHGGITWRNNSNAYIDISGGVWGTDPDNYPFRLGAGGVSGTYATDGGSGPDASWGIGVNGVLFPDATTQTTAGLPLTGGTVTGGITLTGQYDDPAGQITFTDTAGSGFNTIYSGNGINFGTGSYWSWDEGIHVNSITLNSGSALTFPDFSFQTTAFPPTDGTTSQYIRGDGSLQTFPTIPSISGLLVASNNLSDVSNSTTARSNLGLGSMATQPASAYLSTASAVANYQTIAGMSAYLSTSAASSTYLTQSNASSTYLTQANASTTYIGTSAYATTAQAEAMTSTTTVLSPARFRDAYFTANVTKPNTSTWLTGTSGTGGLNDSGTWDFRRLEGPTSAANTYVRCDHGTNFGKGRNYNGNIDWTKYNALYFRITQYAGADANSIFRAVLGEPSGTNTGDPTVRSVGIRFNGTGAIKILAHNGTTLTTYTTSTSLTTSSATDILIVSDGSGTVEVFANGTSIGSTSGGPTTLLAGTAAQSGINYRIENNNTPSGNQVKTIIAGTTAYIS